MLRCKVSNGLSISPLSATDELSMPCVGRGAKNWKIVYLGRGHRVDTFFKDALGFMLKPGNFYMHTFEKPVDGLPKTAGYHREVSMQAAFEKIGQKWPDMVFIDIPNTFCFVERFFTKDTWAKIIDVLHAVPVVSLDFNDRGDYSPLHPEHPLMSMEVVAHIKREPCKIIENYPSGKAAPMSTWLGPSCRLYDFVPWSEREWNLMFWCNDTSPLRLEILKSLKHSRFWDDPRSIIYLENCDANPAALALLKASTDNTLKPLCYPTLPYEVFGKLVANSKILYAPEGYGQFTHRHVEGLLSGTAVVSAPSVMSCDVPMKDCFFIAETADAWPVLSEAILAKGYTQTMSEKMVVQAREALLWYSVPGKAQVMGGRIAEALNRFFAKKS